MKKKTLKEILEESVINLFKNQPNIYDFTPQTGQTEWNLAHHLAYEVWEFFPDLDCDLDVMKSEYNNMRPDIIFHKRGDNDENFLVIEVKYERRQKDIEDDLNKIKEFWFKGMLHYQYGAVIHLYDDKTGEVFMLQNIR